MNRRTFLQSTAALAASPALAQRSVSPSNKITMGVIGCGNQGTGGLMGFLKDERIQVVAVCDVNRETPGYWNGVIGGREPARAIVEWNYAQAKRSGQYKGCTPYEDYREVLARKDIDVLFIAIPDHWHSIPVVEGARAGKDIYGEKPLALTIAEGRAMSNAIKQNNRIFQCGSQQRSDARFRRACEIVRNGRIGKLHTVRCGLPGGAPDFGRTGDRFDPEPIPEGFNYDFWLGPAPEAPYSPARCFVNFRWNYDYSGGQVTDWGGHHPDIGQWGMGMELSGPVAIRNVHAQFAKHKIWNTATDYSFDAIYENGVKMIVSNHEKMGVTFEGSDGWVWVTRGEMDADPKSLITYEPEENEIHLYKSENHYRNFIDCVISRKEPVAPIEQAHRSITVAHLGNISMRLGRELRWDPKVERFIDDDGANAMLSRPMRKPWRLS
ncbi:MAG: Gfo/Idh/MocA family oxidoreductase [Candidatus Solibacter usitatus]|nr:Gfo/Idh/MocA family oxidoreductase [Candidatus Solibacter usitatus]